VNTIANIEMSIPAQTANRGATAQDSDQSSMSFSDSLQAASNAVAAPNANPAPAVPSGTASVSARGQKSGSDSGKSSGKDTDGHAVQQDSSQQTQAPQQTPDAQQAQLTASIVIPVQPTVVVPVALSNAPSEAAEQSAQSVAVAALNGNASAPPQPKGSFSTVIQSNRTQVNTGLLRTASSLAGSETENKDAVIGTLSKHGSNESDATTNIGANGAQGATQPSRAVQNAGLNVATKGVQSAPSQAELNAAQNAASNTQVNAASNARANVASNAQISAASSAIDSASAATTANASVNVTANAAASAVANAASNSVAIAVASTVANTVASAAAHTVSKSTEIARPSTDAVAGVGKQTDSSTATSATANASRNPILDAALKAVSTSLLNAQAVPVLHAEPKAAVKEAAAPATSAYTTSKAASAAASSQSASTGELGTSASISDQLAALTQHSLVSSAAGQSNASGANSPSMAKPLGANGANGTIADAAGLKQHAQTASDAGSQAGSQDSSSSSDQSQSAVPVAVQSAVMPQIAVADHSGAAVAQVQSGSVAGATQGAPTLAPASGHVAKAADTAAPAPAGEPQTLPAINSARLIQSMGQTEMRVGMRSNEFGNISINTSSTRDLISAQISVDHGELAKTLAAHLPEMQARLGGDQPMNVRIDMNGTNTGLGSGSSGSMSNGSADQSQGGRQQAGNAASSYSGATIPERQFSPVAAAMTSADGRLSARLDITV
jgi:hypothetical protein